MENNKNILHSEGNELNEERLEEVAGGKGGNGDELGSCYFTPKNNNVRSTNGEKWLECASGCFGCKCRWNAWCVDRWHRLDDNLDLYPRLTANHKHKKRPTYNT